MSSDDPTTTAAHPALVVDGGPDAPWGREPHIQDGCCACLCDRCYDNEDSCICPDCTDCPDHPRAANV